MLTIGTFDATIKGSIGAGGTTITSPGETQSGEELANAGRDLNSKNKEGGVELPPLARAT
jgi:hypothetical protein